MLDEDCSRPAAGAAVNSPNQELQRAASSVDPWSLISALLNNCPDPVQICDHQGRSLYTNDAFRRVLGRQPPPGLNILDEPSFAPAAVVQQLRRAFAGEEVILSAFWSNTAPPDQSGDGAPSAYMSLRALPLHAADGTVALVVLQFEDCTSQQSSREEQERLIVERDVVLEQSPQGIVICNTHGGYRLFNRAAERLWGGRRDVHSIADWTHFRAYHRNGARYTPVDWPLARSIESGAVVDGEEIQIERFDGSRAVVLNASAPLHDPGGRIVGGVAVFSDISNLRDLEHQRDRFITVASHELRTPLTTLLGYTQLLVRRLQRGDPPERLQPSAANILRAGRRLDRLVNQLVDVSQLDRGSLTLRRDPCDLTAVARGVIDEVSSRDSSITIHLDAPESMVGTWDAGRVEQSLYNLLDNAVRYGHPRTPIAVHLRDQPNAVAVSVENAGEHLDPETVAHLFERFAPPVAQGKPFAAGLGLGLYMTRAIVSAHGGSISALARPEGGLIVQFTLPRAG